MTEAQFQLFLSSGIGICAVMAVISLLRMRRIGYEALTLTAAFFCMGGALLGIRGQVSPIFVWVLGVAVIVLLITDFVLRAARMGK